MPKNINYVIVTPVRDEASFVEKTIQSVTCQTVLPNEWILVDDGSTDGTGEIIDNWKKRYSWIKVIHRRNRGFRVAGGGVVEAFYDGFAAISNPVWDFIVKLDGDLSFKEDYFEKCFEKFDEDPRLGIGGGLVCYEAPDELKEESVGDPPFHVRGATKIYRRSCWDLIAPIVSAAGWDTIDEVKANMLGWRTRSFRDIKLIQHKPTGRADGIWRNWFKNGRANYITGYHPLFMIGKCVKRAFHKPPLIQSAMLWAGFFSGYFLGLTRVSDKAVIKFLRQQQIRRMLMRTSIYG
jgi:glycosyltransferase involved in cell wall biosynthesis